MSVLPKSDDPDRDLYVGLIRLHILHHAVKAPSLASVCRRNSRDTAIVFWQETAVTFERESDGKKRIGNDRMRVALLS